MPVTMQATATQEPPVLAYARLLRVSQELIDQGKGDSEEAVALSEEMDVPWQAMTDQEQDRMRGLSVDLYTLAEGGSKQVSMSPEEAHNWEEEARAACTRLIAGEVDAALAFFRRPAPRG